MFGVSVEDDDARLQNEIRTIEHGLRNYTKGFLSTTTSLYSMEIHTNHRIDNIKNGLKYTSPMIKTTASELIRVSQYVNQSSHRLLIMRKEIDAILYYNNLLFTLSVTLGHNLDILLSLTKSQLFVLSELLYGRIPTVLITPDMITKVIMSIGIMLEVKWPMFKVAVSSFVEVYATPDFGFTISDRNIFVAVNIPITLQESLFDVYQVFYHDVGEIF